MTLGEMALGEMTISPCKDELNCLNQRNRLLFEFVLFVLSFESDSTQVVY